MRKAHLHALNLSLRAENERLRTERDGVLKDLGDTLASIRADVATVDGKVSAHAAALARHREDLSGLAEAVRASLLSRPEPAAPAEDAAKPVTPIASKRGSRSAG